MKNVIGMLIVLGLFSTYGAFNLLKTQEFRETTNNGRASQDVTTADENPEDFKTTLAIAVTMALTCFLSAGILTAKQRSKK